MKTIKKKYKYEQIIEHINISIKNKVLPEGAKLPSLRHICNQFTCSMSVAMQAYSELEMQGTITSIEKSGFFVIPAKTKELPLPQKAPHTLKITTPKTKPIISRVVDLSNNSSIISLGAGIPDKTILPLNKLNKIITRNTKEKPELLCTYTSGKGNLNLRNALISFLFKRGVIANSEDIIITNGCMEALSLAIRATTKENDIVAIENPVFFGLINLLRQLKRKVIEIPTDISTGINLDILEKVVKSNDVKICLVSSVFQNPLGFIMPEENKQKIVSLSKKFKFTIIEDDIYSETGFIQKTYRPISAYDNSNNVIYCSSFSKSISPGIRIGWIIPKKYIDICENMKFAESIGGPNLLQASMADFLTEGSYDYFIKHFRKKLANQMYAIKDAIKNYFPKNIKISNPHGGYFLWVELPSHIDSLKLFEEAITQGVSIVPGIAFTTTNRYRNCIRISAGAPVTEKTLTAISILGDLIRSQRA